MCVAGKTVWCPALAIGPYLRRFRDEVHDEALYKSTFFTLLYFCFSRGFSATVANTGSVAFLRATPKAGDRRAI